MGQGRAGWDGALNKTGVSCVGVLLDRSHLFLARTGKTWTRPSLKYVEVRLCVTGVKSSPLQQLPSAF